MTSSFRALFATTRSGETPETVSRETENLLVFLKAQREYGVSNLGPELFVITEIEVNAQELLARYNPLHDLSADDHRKATAHRVGLDMPKEYQDEQ